MRKFVIYCSAIVASALGLDAAFAQPPSGYFPFGALVTDNKYAAGNSGSTCGFLNVRNPLRGSSASAFSGDSSTSAKISMGDFTYYTINSKGELEKYFVFSGAAILTFSSDDAGSFDWVQPGYGETDIEASKPRVGHLNGQGSFSDFLATQDTESGAWSISFKINLYGCVVSVAGIYYPQ